MNKPIYLIVVLCFFAISLSAQDSPRNNKRPKVGLVLSGGGAKGMAHIGVIKVLEEVGIKPDYIAGTSMGSIMGGLYSIGYSANELDSIVRQIDWTQMLSDKIPLSMVVPVEKHDYNRFLLTFPLEITGPRLPDGLISGQGIAEEMNHLTWRVADIDSFDDYPIPFRCVASDLISGKPHVFKSGKLSTAMRASMAIPSVFSPVRIDSMLLVDGGVLDNLPVSTCREMGADIIISVNVGFEDKPDADDFKSIMDVMMGAAMIRSNYEAAKSIEDSDVLIAPSLGNYSAGSFTSGIEIIDLGEKGARKQIDELKELAKYLNEFDQADEVEELANVDELYISELSIDKLYTLDEKFVVGKFGLTAGSSYSKNDINAGLHRLVGTRYIDDVNYTLSPQGNGYAMVLEINESYRSKLSVGIHYDNVYKAGATINASFRNLLVLGSHFKISFDISEFPRLATDFYDYIGVGQKVGTYAKVRWENNKMPIYYDNGTDIGHFTNAYFEGDAGLFLAPGSKSILSLGGFYKNNLLNFKKGLFDIIGEDLDKLGNKWWGIRLNYNKNSLDKQFFAENGSYLDVNLDIPLQYEEIYKGPDSLYSSVGEYIYVPYNHYIKATIVYKRHFPITKKFNCTLEASGGAASASLPFADLFYIGGISPISRNNDVNFYGLMPRELLSSQFMIVGTDLRYAILPGFHIHGIINALDSYNEGHVSLYDDSASYEGRALVWGGGLKLSYQSLLGPIEVGYARNSLHSASRWYIAAGFPF